MLGYPFLDLGGLQGRRRWMEGAWRKQRRVAMEDVWMEGTAWRRGRGCMEGWMEWKCGSVRAVRCRVGSVVLGFYGSQGWTVPGGSVPVCGSVRGLRESFNSWINPKLEQTLSICMAPVVFLLECELLETLWSSSLHVLTRDHYARQCRDCSSIRASRCAFPCQEERKQFKKLKKSLFQMIFTCRCRGRKPSRRQRSHDVHLV